MGLFNSVKNAFSSTGLADYWNVVDDPSSIKSILEASEEHPQLIYKHSYRCATSLFARKQVEQSSEDMSRHADLHFVDVIAHRRISNQIADRLNVRHESPQLLLVDQRKAVWHVSHGAIKSEAIVKALQEF